MKKLLLLLLFLPAFTFGQVKIKVYHSDMNFDEQTSKFVYQPFKISIWKSKLGDEYLQILNINNHTVEDENSAFKISYLKTTSDEVNTMRWYKITDGITFNVVKECFWKKPENIDGKFYKTYIILSKYDEDGQRLYDRGYMINNTKIQ